MFQEISDTMFGSGVHLPLRMIETHVTGLTSLRLGGFFDREGVTSAADVAIVGDAAVLKESLNRLADIGVTDFMASPSPAGEDAVERTIDFLTAQL